MNHALRRLALCTAMLVLPLGLSACGVKGPLEAPPSARAADPGPGDPPAAGPVGRSPTDGPAARRRNPLDWLVD